MLGRDGLYCDYCEKKMRRYIHLPAQDRKHPEAGWSWIEAHAACLKTADLSKFKLGRRERRTCP